MFEAGRNNGFWIHHPGAGLRRYPNPSGVKQPDLGTAMMIFAPAAP